MAAIASGQNDPYLDPRKVNIYNKSCRPLPAKAYMGRISFEINLVAASLTDSFSSSDNFDLASDGITVKKDVMFRVCDFS